MENIRFADITPTMLSYEIVEDDIDIEISSVHNYFIMDFVLEGSAVFNNGNMSVTLKRDQAMLFSPGDERTVASVEERPLRFISVGFYGVRVSEFVKMLCIDTEKPFFNFPANRELMQFFPANANTETGGDFVALSLIYKVFAYMYNKRSKSMNNYVSKAIDYIDNNIGKPLRISEVAAELDISRVYLHKAFVEAFGVPPKLYITNRKMMLAYEAIRSRKMSVSAAAEMIGYSDQFAFSKLFKSKYQMPPRDIAGGKTPYVQVLDDEAGETVWPSVLTTERSYNGGHSHMAKPYYDAERDVVEGWVLRAGYINSAPLPRTLDISLITDNGRAGLLTFWIFVENQSRITNWCIDSADWIRFGSSPDWDTDFQYWLGWHKQIVKEGWNKIVLPFGDSAWGRVCGNPDYKNFCSFGLMLSVPKFVRIFIDDIKVIPSN